MKYIIDTQLPPKLAVFFHDKGVDAIHTTHFPDGHLLKDKEISICELNKNKTKR